MQSVKRNAFRRADRVRLILEVRKAYKRFAALLQYRDDSPQTRAALVRTTRELSLMNRALALVALQSAEASSVSVRW